MSVEENYSGDSSCGPDQLRTSAFRVAGAVAVTAGLGCWMVDMVATWGHLVGSDIGHGVRGTGVLLISALASGTVVLLPALLGLMLERLVAAVGQGGACRPWIQSGLRGACYACLITVLLWDLLSGPWISQQWYATPLRILAICAAVVVTTFVARSLTLRRRFSPFNLALSLGMVVLLAWVDQSFLQRRYPAFHHLLLLGILGAAGATGFVLSRSWPLFFPRRGMQAACALALVSTLVTGTEVIPGNDPWLRALAFDEAPLAGKVLRLLATGGGGDGAEASLSARAAWDLRPVCDPAILDRRAPDRQRWNLLFITLDTVRADHVGCYGHGRETTPNLDRLARRSVRFENCYAQGPTSGPSMSSMFNGRYLSAFHLGGGRAALSREGARIPMMAERFRDAGFTTEAVTALPRSYLRTLFRFLRPGFQKFNDYPHDRELPANQVVDQAIARLDTKGANPFFMWVHLFDAHAQYVAHEEHDFGVAPVDLYDGEIAFADAQLGRLLDHLAAMPTARRTVVVVHSDHGEEFLEHGGRFHNSSVHDEQVRVPLVIHIPGAAPAVVAQPVELVDLLPSFMTFFGLASSPEIHGQSLLPFIFPRAVIPAPGGQRVPAPLALSQIRVGGAPPLMQDALRFGDWKLIHDTRADTFKLFDLSSDPGEQRNLAFEKPRELTELRDLLRAAHERMRTAVPDAAVLSALRASDSELLRRAQNGKPARRIEAGRMLAMRGQESQACKAVLPALDQEIPPAVALDVLDLLLMARHRAAVPTLERLVQRATAEIRTRVCLVLAGFGDDTGHTLLQRLAGDEDAHVADMAHVGLGLCGQVESRKSLESIASRGAGSSRMLAVAALVALGGEAHRTTLAALLGDPKLSVPELFLCATAAAREGSPELIVALYAALRSVPVRVRRADFLSHELKRQGAQANLPFLRLDLGSLDASVREAAATSLEARLPGSDPRRLGLIQHRLDAVHEAFSSPRPKDDLKQVCSGFEQFLVGREQSDWGVTYDLWQFVTATGEGARAARVLAGLSAGASGPEVALKDRLARVSASRDLPARCSLRVIGGSDDPVPGQRIWPLTLEISVPEDASGIEGGPGPCNATLLASWSHESGRQSEKAWRHPLPPLGILPGETVRLVLPLHVPDDLPPGPAVLTLGLARLHPAGFVAPPLRHNVTVTNRR